MGDHYDYDGALDAVEKSYIGDYGHPEYSELYIAIRTDMDKGDYMYETISKEEFLKRFIKALQVAYE